MSRTLTPPAHTFVELRTCARLALALVSLSIASTLASASLAADWPVSTPAEFNQAGNNANPGDAIVIQDGTYLNWGQLRVMRPGVTVRPQTLGGVTFQEFIEIRIAADDVTVKGLRFEGPTPTEDPETASICEACTIVLVNATGTTIQDSEFFERGIPTGSNTGVVRLYGATVNTVVRDNLFDTYYTPGVALFSPLTTHVTVEGNTFIHGRTESAVFVQAEPPAAPPTYVDIIDNVFEDHISQNGNGTEMIQIKTSNNTVSGNKFIDCQGHVSNRGGQFNRYIGNYFVNQDNHGIRIADANNTVANNLFVNVRSPIFLMWGGPGYQPVVDAVIANNTIVDPVTIGIQLYQHTDTTIPPSRTIVANNVFIGEGARLTDTDLGTQLNMSRNHFYATDGQPITGLQGAQPTNGDPLFSPEDATGTFAAGSPVIDGGVPVAFLGVNEDFHGSPRPSKCVDIGHLEASGSACGATSPVIDSVQVGGRFVITNGAPDELVGVKSGETRVFQAIASDVDGLGFPSIFWAGVPDPLSYVYDLDGGTTGHPLEVWNPNPTVQFDLPPGVSSDTFNVSLKVLDYFDDQTTVEFPVIVRETGPSVEIRYGGQAVEEIEVVDGQPVQLEAIGSDPPYGLGYPVFWWLDNYVELEYIWSFGGATPSGPWEAFKQNPVVTFDVASGTSQTFQVTVTAYSSLGISEEATIEVTAVAQQP